MIVTIPGLQGLEEADVRSVRTKLASLNETFREVSFGSLESEVRDGTRDVNARFEAVTAALDRRRVLRQSSLTSSSSRTDAKADVTAPPPRPLAAPAKTAPTADSMDDKGLGQF